MLQAKSNYMTYNDGWGIAYAVVDRKLDSVKQEVIHFREATVGERRYWDAYIAGSQITRAVYVPYASAIDQGDVFVIDGDQYEVAQKDRKDTKPRSWLLSLKKAVVRFGG